jgi:hypothetical protein
MTPLINPHSPLWITLRARLNERIEKLRDDLEQPGADDLIRGEIRGLRWLIGAVDIDLPDDDSGDAYVGDEEPSIPS